MTTRQNCQPPSPVLPAESTGNAGFPFGYRALRKLSSSSEVYLCREYATERLLILKFFSREKEACFTREGRILSRLQGFPGSPDLYFAGAPDDSARGRTCLGMQYRPGKS